MQLKTPFWLDALALMAPSLPSGAWNGLREIGLGRADLEGTNGVTSGHAAKAMTR
jgi:hypothetical protein